MSELVTTRTLPVDGWLIAGRLGSERGCVSLSIRFITSASCSMRWPATSRTQTATSRVRAGWTTSSMAIRHLACALEAMLGIGHRGARDDAIERLGNVDAELARGGKGSERVRGELHEERVVPLAGMAPTTDEQLPQDHARGVDVGTPIDRSHDLLRGHVRDLALDDAFPRLLRVDRGLGDAEIEDAGHAVFSDEHVGGRDVAMNDAEGFAEVTARLVRAMEALEHVAYDGRDDAHRDGAHDMARHERLERLAEHELHDEEDLGLVGDDIERRDDVRMFESRREPGLVEEHVDEVRIVRVVGMEALDGDHTLEPDGAMHAAEVDRRHASSGNLVEDVIAAERAREVHQWTS